MNILKMYQWLYEHQKYFYKKTKTKAVCSKVQQMGKCNNLFIFKFLNLFYLYNYLSIFLLFIIF